MALRTVGVRLTAEVADYQRKMREAGRTTREFKAEMERAATGGKLDQVADQAALLGAGLTATAGYATKLAADFEKAMSGVKAATRASASELELLRAAAVEAGKDTQYSATQAADAITELSKAGVSTSAILGGGLTGALDLAAAGQLDVAEAAETAASAMVQFRLDGSKVPHIADLLAAGAGKAQGSVHDMGAALNQAGLIAAQTGLTVEDTTGALAAFANAGLIGSDAGTSFKTMLQALQAPSNVTKNLMDELGISAYDAAGQFIGITALAEQLRTKLGGLTQAERDHALAQIFGSDATRAANILYREGAAGITEWIGKVNDAGYAAETAKIQTDNLVGDLERLKGSLETLAIESGGGANSGLRVLTKSAEALIDQVGTLPSAITGTGTVLAALAGTLLLGAAGWAKLRRSTADALAELRETGPAGTRAAAGLEKTTKWAGRAAAAFVAAEVAAAGVSAAFGQDLNPQTAALVDSLQKWVATGERSGEAARLLGDDFEHLAYDLGTLDSGFWAGLGNGISGTAESLTGLGDVADESLTHARQRIQALDSALAQMVQDGQADKAARVFELLAAEAKKSGVNVDELKKGLPQYSGAVQLAGKESADTAGQIDGLGAAAEGAADKTEELTKAFDDLFDQQMSVDRAALKLKESTLSLTEELLKGKRTLSLNSEEGRKNRTVVLDQLEAIEDLRAARVKHGMTLDEASRKYVKDIDGLKKSMIQAGFTKSGVDDLVGAYEDIPGTVNTKVSASGVDATKGKLDDLLIYQQALKKGISVSAAASAFRKNAYHDGGWTGRGGEWDEAGIVHADEYVIRKSSRRKIEQQHPGLLDEMNATGQLPGYARGGQVWPFPATARMTRIPSRREAAAAVTPDFGTWPSSPSAQRGDSGVWRGIVAMIRATGPMSGSFGNAYRPGDPLWHGSGRAVDWMGFNQDRLASFLAAKRPLELIHRTRNRDYAYTRGVNKGSFNNALMNAHRNHIHIAMANGGMIREPVLGIGASGTTYSLGENYQPERVVPSSGNTPASTAAINVTISAPITIHGGNQSPHQIAAQVNREIGAQFSQLVRGIT